MSLISYTNNIPRRTAGSRSAAGLLILVFFGLILTACITDNNSLDIQIGDFDHYKDLWDKQNILNYQLNIQLFDYTGPPLEVSLDIQDGYLVSNDPLWPSNVYPTTVPELFSYIEQSVQRIKTEAKNSAYDTFKFHVLYNEHFYYPEQINSSVSKSSILNSDGNYSASRWNITLVPIN